MEDKKLLLMRNLRFIGLTLFFSGLCLSTLSYVVMYCYGFYPSKLLYGGIFIVPLGLAMTICKGKDLTEEESRLRDHGDASKMTYFRYVRQQAPLFHRIIWIISLIIGVVLIVYMRDLLGIS